MEDGRLARPVRTKMVMVREHDDAPRKRHRLKFSWLAGSFAVCRLPVDAAIPDWAWSGPFTSVTRTADELSIVCLADNLPTDINSEHHWMCFKIEGPFSLSEVGVLASFIGPLADNGVPIFAISTHDTDYVLISEDYAGVVQGALQAAGHELLL